MSRIGDYVRFIALLRGINAGKSRRIDMKDLKKLLQNLGYVGFSSYINSGNLIFSSSTDKRAIHVELENAIQAEFGFRICVLIKTQDEIRGGLTMDYLSTLKGRTA
jgi:uncharacterized protein (DUF1697 family)